MMSRQTFAPSEIGNRAAAVVLPMANSNLRASADPLANADEPAAHPTPPADQPSDGGTATKVRAKPSKRQQTKKMPPYNVVLLNDDDHSYEYVIKMLGLLFSHPVERAIQMAKEVDSTGRVIVLTTHLELAELKRDQIHAYGPDKAIATCTRSMNAVVEPAEG